MSSDSEEELETLEEVLQDDLEDARHYGDIGLFTKSLEKYMKYFAKTPEEFRARDSENEFIDLLCDLEIFFKEENSMEELLKCFLYALQWFPNNSKLHNRFGSILIRNGENNQGTRYILQAYKVAEENKESLLAIENNMLHLMWRDVPRWHFRMLNGKLRNETYKKAIHRALDKGFKNVLDIGSGCGLLGLYAGTHESCPNIVSFEANSVLFEKCKKLMSKYCESVDYSCHNTFSYFKQKLGEIHRDLLVTEIFDVAVFGEGILKTLEHASEVLMQKENYCVIPAGVTVYVTGITCKSLDKKYRLQNSIPTIQLENICATKLSEDDPYDAETLVVQKYDLLTETNELMKLNFADKSAIKRLCGGFWKSRVTLQGIKDGFIDSLVVWFDLHLDNETVISTNPFHSQNEPCWEQAIFHCKHPVEISVDKNVTFNVRVHNEYLKFDPMYTRCSSSICFELSEQCIRFLNDEKWVEYLISISERAFDNQRLIILDFSMFPLLGLLLSKKGHKVYHFSKEVKDVIFAKYLMTKNDIDTSLVSFVDYDMYPQYILQLEADVDYAIFEPICPDGSLMASPLDNVIFKKFKAKQFFEDVIVHFVLIYSPYLNYCNRVDEENVRPFDEIAEEMNEYVGSEHPNLPHDFPHEQMSSEQTWNAAKNPLQIESVTVSKNGKINGILTWYTLVGEDGMKFCTKTSFLFNKNALMVPETKVEAEQIIKLLCQYETGGLFKIQICQEMWLRTNFERVTNTSCFADYFKKNFNKVKN